MRARVMLAAVTVSVVCGACGYSFSGSSLPGHIHTIAVPIFANETLDAMIADEVTRGMVERFLTDNRLKVVRESGADCVLEGKVVQYERKVYSYTANQEPETYVVVVRIAVVLKDRVKNRDLWADERLEATATYPASGEAEGSSAADTEGATSGTHMAANESEARSQAIRLLAQDILARTLEQW